MLCYVVIRQDSEDINFTEVLGAFKDLNSAKQCLKDNYISILNDYLSDKANIEYNKINEDDAIITTFDNEILLNIHETDLC